MRGADYFEKGSDMHSVIFEEFGSPAQVLKLAERPKPEPGPGEVRVRMVMSAIHNHDLMIIAGQYGMKPELPAVPGTEAVGVVDALGAGVTALKVGQRVCGGGSAMWAEYFVAGAASLIALPDAVPDETACQLIAMPISAFRLVEELEVKAGDWIIQNAANGAVGKMLAGFAAERGINVVNLVRRDAAIAELQEVGIGNAISTEQDGWEERIRDLTKGAPIVRGLDSIGGDGPDALLSVMADESVLYFFGALSGRKLRITPANVLFKRATIKGFWAAKPSTLVSPQAIGAMIGELVRRAASGQLRLPVAEVFPLAQAAAAAGASDEPGRRGKIALRGS
ncbi:MAG TPA: zinc-binding dehydrogenase [Devosiaceae bacterium]|jgi:NADPH:quinone reductase-like Zn-dependent oxidoreductase